jgi:hypothetical protein
MIYKKENLRIVAIQLETQASYFPLVYQVNTC